MPEAPPNDDQTALKPVIVFIYGGGFQLGTSHVDVYNPELLLLNDVIVVQPNYRLGAFGWITDGSNIPKNLGFLVFWKAF